MRKTRRMDSGRVIQYREMGKMKEVKEKQDLNKED